MLVVAWELFLTFRIVFWTNNRLMGSKFIHIGPGFLNPHYSLI
jgi:hypothetical protein